MSYIDYLSSNYKKGGMLMVSRVKVSINFAIIYVAGGIAPELP